MLTAGPGWEWVFYINVPIGLAVLAMLPTVVPAHPGQATRRIDFAGALTVTAATGAAIYGLINTGDHGWTTPSTLWPLAGAVLLYAAFALVERTVRAPLMDLRILTRRPVLAGAFLMLVATGLLIASFILAALGSGMPVLWSGPTALVTGISVAAAGLGATFVAATTTSLARVAHHEAGLTSGIVTTFHELGAAIGVAVISSVAAVSIATTGAGTIGFTNAFTVSMITAAAAGVIALLLVPAGKPPAGAVPHAH